MGDHRAFCVAAPRALRLETVLCPSVGGMTSPVRDLYDTLPDARAEELRAHNKQRLAKLEAEQEEREARLARTGWTPGAGMGSNCSGGGCSHR